MKGKGKNRSEVKVKSETVSELPLKPAELTVADVNICPTYMFGVKKSGKGVPVRDLLSLQYELEYMHVSMVRRQEQIKAEISNLENPAAYRNKRSRSSDSDRKCAKKSKKCKGNGKKSTPCRPKNKFVQPPPKSFECGITDLQIENPRPSKNDGPSRFWAFIEPYCAGITDDDIKAIEAWIKTHENDSEYQKIPELGSHFTKKWTKDDIVEEIKEGSKSVENQKGLVDSDIPLINNERNLKRGEKECNQIEMKNSCNQGGSSLTQRLISTLVHEKVMTSPDVCLTESSKDETPETSNPKKSSKSISPSKESLQKKLCKGLSELGVMDFEDSERDDSEDEILKELKKLQMTLIPVCNKNLKQKQHLLAVAKIEMKKQDIKKKLKEVDAKVMEVYREVYAARCENKAPSKKCAAQIRKTLSERQAILRQLENMT